MVPSPDENEEGLQSWLATLLRLTSYRNMKYKHVWEHVLNDLFSAVYEDDYVRQYQDGYIFSIRIFFLFVYFKYLMMAYNKGFETRTYALFEAQKIFLEYQDPSPTS